MVIVDHRDLEILDEIQLRKLLRWTATEILRRENGDTYEIENEITEALLIHFGEDKLYYCDIYRK